MAKVSKTVDVDDMPELARIAEEVRDTGEARLLRRDGEGIAVLIPVARPGRRRPKRPKSQSDYEAFGSAAGGWKDVDTDRLIADIYADRSIAVSAESSLAVIVQPLTEPARMPWAK